MRRPLVALAIETSSIYGRRILEGISTYMRDHTDWRVQVEQRSLHDRPADWLTHFQGNGILSRATSAPTAQSLLKTKIPIVDLTDRSPSLGLPTIRSNDLAIGQLAAEHFIACRLQQFAFCGFLREDWSRLRWEGFRNYLENQNYHPSLFETQWLDLATHLRLSEESKIAQWLLTLTPPVGILCCNDVRAHHLLNACAMAGLRVPQDICILGVDNDDVLCELCRPTISSIIPNPFLIGFRAAEMLDRWMHGQPPEHRVQWIDPIGLRQRQSSDLERISDPLMAEAMRQVRTHACAGLTVENLVLALGVTRGTLERGFRKWFQTTPQQAIRKTQLNHAQHLLAQTDWSIARISRELHMSNPDFLYLQFKKHFKVSPTQYRDSVRPRCTSHSEITPTKPPHAESNDSPL